ncbi:hyaluronidase PH-20-like [Sigmodon hispidus]
MDLTQATARAKQEFEEAAKKLMKETLKLGTKLRPQYLWGFYLFPDCYNNRYRDQDYNGTCPKIEIDRNNQLNWIWEESTALYPSTYLRSELKLSPKAKLYNRFRVLEGIRLSKTGCPNLHKFMRTTLNPYIINTTLAAKMCSQTLCDLQGICTRKDVHSDHYIQLNPEHLEIKLLKNGSFGIVGNPTIGDLKYFAKHFKCSCFTNMKCKERDDIENVENVKVCTANNICINTYRRYHFKNKTITSYSVLKNSQLSHNLFGGINNKSRISDPLPEMKISTSFLMIAKGHQSFSNLWDCVTCQSIVGLNLYSLGQGQYLKSLYSPLMNACLYKKATKVYQYQALWVQLRSDFWINFLESNGAPQTVLVFLLLPCCLTVDFRAPPLIPNVPFLWAWNAPTESCLTKFNEPIDLSLFSLVGSPRKTATGQPVTIFYTDRLGFYPHIDDSQRSIHGGIPQLGSLKRHLAKSRNDIEHYIPMDNVGLAVIDWEEWRPTWSRNWRPKDIYRNKSIELVQQQNMQLNLSEITKRAKREFEQAGRRFMEETLKLGQSLRPNHLWGFYMFPDCYNNQFQDADYNGNCPDIEKKRNDALAWLWKESTALFPSIYLKSKLKSSPKAALYVRNRVQEAIRVSKTKNPQNPVPIFVYSRIVFADVTFQFLQQDDLVNTIGETVALGVSGMVIWGTLGLARSMKSCLNLHDYLENTLNPYLINVTLAAKMCSQTLCQDQGMCSRKDWNSDDYLHLSSKNFQIQFLKSGKYEINGSPTLDDLEYFSKKFRCSCYPNLNCKERNDLESVTTISVCAVEDACINSFVIGEPSALPTNWKNSVRTTSNQSDIVMSSATGSPYNKGKHQWISVCFLYLFTAIEIFAIDF